MPLASGAEVKVTAADIDDSWNLFQAFLKIGLTVPVKRGDELPNTLKDIFCASLANKDMHALLMICAQKCTYNGLKIEQSMFQSVKAREDYLEVLYLVAEANLKPFTKSLYARFKDILSKIENIQA